uniref:Uncharacterized protein n=1 Tax=Tetradesmus obliquus TaxID=3088 RepID=A0A383WNY8_TETOB
MISIHGFDGQANQAPTKRRMGPQRRRSLLSESLKCSSFHSSSSRCSLDSASSLESCLDEADFSSEECDSQEDARCSSFGTAPMLINYSKAAKARIEKAEAQGRAREEQMELLQAVRAYMAQARQQAAAKALATQQV